MTNLYTFIMDYLGGTYISQIEAENNDQAMQLWIRNLEVKEIKGLSQKAKDKIIKAGFASDEAILLKGLENVWCFDVRTKKGFGLINFIKTDRNSQK